MEKIKLIKEKIMNNKLLAVILITGVIFLLFPGGGEKEKVYEGDYEKELSERAEDILSEIEGVGRVSLMISFYDKGKSVPITDKSGSGNGVSERVVSSSGKIALMKEEYPSVRGVLVVCEGGEDICVREKVINALSALTGAPIHNIKVYKMEG